jgi:hypothetical protein
MQSPETAGWFISWSSLWNPITANSKMATISMNPHRLRRCARRRIARFAPVALLLAPAMAEASIFQGETLDMVANIMAWVVLIIAPTVAIVVFWLVHILPEKIAEKRQHPQAKAIQTLCLLSLVFGGMLWPLAWLWAYSKPVLYKMAYGTDRVVHGEDEAVHETPNDTPPPSAELTGPRELEELRQRLADLEARLAGSPTSG